MKKKKKLSKKILYPEIKNFVKYFYLSLLICCKNTKNCHIAKSKLLLLL